MSWAGWRGKRRERAAGYLPGVDAVVVNYRTPDDLVSFVASVAEHARDIPIDLVIANVAPQAGDLEAAEQCAKMARPGLSIRHMPHVDNVGYARACNSGTDGGRREVVALFNADTVVTPRAIETCHQVLLENPKWGALGPRQVDQLGRLTASGIIGSNEKPKQRGWHQQDVGQFSDIRVDAVTVAGAAYFMRRAVWQELTNCPSYRAVAPEAVGAFLPTRLFFEETYCSYHAGAHGYRNVYYGPVQMIHTWHGSINQNEAPAEDLFAESQQYFRDACDAHGIARN